MAGAGRGGRGPLPLRAAFVLPCGGWGQWGRAARDAGGLWDTNPSISLSAGALT